jgi:predicted ATPase with chaperone activity
MVRSTANAITSLTRLMPRGRPCGRCDHDLLLGPPGAGTSRPAQRLTALLPEITLAEAIETTRIHRVDGLTAGRMAFVTASAPSV